MPLNPADLNTETRKFFPITDRRDLRNVLFYKRILADYYRCKGKLPEEYFRLLKKKKPLSLTLQELSWKYKEMFPIDLSRTNLSIKDISEKLKEDYYFKMIPNDYFVQKPRLPMDTKRIVTKTSYIYPIESKEEAQKFIEEIKTKYSYNIPLPPNIMTVNPTEKPDLP